MMTTHIHPRPLPRFQFDSPVIIAAMQQDMLAAIDLTPASEQPDMIAAAVADHGGYMQAPQTRIGGWGPFQWEISLLGIMGMGEDFPAALRQWTKCARRSIDATRAQAA